MSAWRQDGVAVAEVVLRAHGEHRWPVVHAPLWVLERQAFPLIGGRARLGPLLAENGLVVRQAPLAELLKDPRRADDLHAANGQHGLVGVRLQALDGRQAE